MDITVRKDVEAMMDGVRTLIHFAAITGIPQCERDPERASLVNAAGLKQLITVGVQDRLEKVIFPSSIAVYGNPPRHVTEDTPLRPISYYGILKRTCEDILNAAREVYGTSVLIFRQSNIHGRSLCRKRSLINLLAEKAKADQPLTLVGTGQQVRDFVHIDDVLDVYVKALSDFTSGTFNLGSGISTPVRDIFSMVRTIAREQLGKDIEVEHQPTRTETPWEVETYFELDINKVQQTFDFSPRRGIEDSLRDLLRPDENGSD
jgi:UDP-glucose 4-epimerase